MINDEEKDNEDATIIEEMSGICGTVNELDQGFILEVDDDDEECGNTVLADITVLGDFESRAGKRKVRKIVGAKRKVDRSLGKSGRRRGLEERKRVKRGKSESEGKKRAKLFQFRH